MFENHSLKTDDIENYEYREGANFKLDVSLEELEKLTDGNEDLEQLLDEMLDNCLRYTETVLKMNMISKERSDEEFAQEIFDASNERKRIHNLTMESIDILARAMGFAGVDNSWINKLKPDPVGDNRSVYGRFAIAMTLYRASEMA